MTRAPDFVSPLDFFDKLVWLDGRPLLDTIEPYRRELFMRAFYEFREDGSLKYNLVLAGRGKKNHKTSDVVIGGLFKLLIPEGWQGNDVLVVANTEDQAGDDLDLAKKLVRANPNLSAELEIQAKEIRRLDGRGAVKILPSRDAIGSHGKTAIFVAFDEIHGFRNWDLLEALQPDPTRTDVQMWMTSYDTIYSEPGVPLVDLKKRGMAGDDPRMLFSWYSGEFCTDPAFAGLPAEQRANPSMASWPEGPAYIEQQRKRLPTSKFRRLHLNLPGAIDGAFYDADALVRAIVPGLRVLSPDRAQRYVGFVDMSGGSNDDATLGIAHMEGRRRVLDLLVSQDGKPPFNPRNAVTKFVRYLREYRFTRVIGDAYAGLTFRNDFEEHGIAYRVSERSKTELYEALEVLLNAGEVELLDLPKMQEQFLTLIVRGSRVDHPNGDHDDWANSAAGAAVLASEGRFTTRRDEFREPRIEGLSGYDPFAWASPSTPTTTTRVH